jgi:hypothetical protein
MNRERTLSFSEREGLTPLPTAYELEELSYEVHNEIKYILDEETAFYFLGACASFVTFVMHKARKNQIRERQRSGCRSRRSYPFEM